MGGIRTLQIGRFVSLALSQGMALPLQLCPAVWPGEFQASGLRRRQFRIYERWGVQNHQNPRCTQKTFRSDACPTDGQSHPSMR